jgi:hypothetical protein
MLTRVLKKGLIGCGFSPQAFRSANRYVLELTLEHTLGVRSTLGVQQRIVPESARLVSADFLKSK